MLPKLTDMKTYPSCSRVSGSSTMSVKHHSRYVSINRVQSLKTSNKLALRELSGMYHRWKMFEPRAVKLRAATLTQRKSFSVMSKDAISSLLAKNKMGTRMRYHFVPALL